MIILQRKNIKECNENWPQILDYPYRILIIGDSGTGKTNSLFIVISHQADIDKNYFLVKDPYEVKYQLLVMKRKGAGLKN